MSQLTQPVTEPKTHVEEGSNVESDDKNENKNEMENNPNYDTGQLNNKSENKTEEHHDGENPEIQVNMASQNDDSGSDSVSKPKTLAGLISAYREQGLQVFNDKLNIPGAEMKRIAELEMKKIEEERRKSDVARKQRNNDETGHQSRQREEMNARQSRTSSKSNYDNTSNLNGSYNDDKNAISRRNRLDTGSSPTKSSANSSRSRGRYGRSTATSRASNFSQLPTPSNKDLDAEEWLQHLMRMRSKRRRENAVTLEDIIKQKQEGLQSSPSKIRPKAITDEGDRVNKPNENEKDVKIDDNEQEKTLHTQQVTENGITHDVSSSDKSQKNNTVNQKSELENHATDTDNNPVPLKSSTPKMAQTETNKAELMQDSVHDSLNKHENETSASSKSNKETITTNENTTNLNKTPGEIDEVRIKEGNMTLVLYKVKTNDITITQNSNETHEDKERPYSENVSLRHNENQATPSLGKQHNADFNSNPEGIITTDTASDIPAINNEKKSLSHNQDVCPSDLSLENERVADDISKSNIDESMPLRTDTQMNYSKLEEKKERNIKLNRKYSDTDKSDMDNKTSLDSGVGTDSENETKESENDVKPTDPKTAMRKANKINGDADGETINNSNGIKTHSDSPVKVTKPKRSLGNGFLVSSVTQDEIHIPNVTETSPHIEDGNHENNDETRNNLSKKGKQAPSAPASEKFRNRKKHVTVNDKASSSSSKVNTSTDEKTSKASTSSSKKSLSSEARMFIFMSQLKQSYDEERELQINYLKEIGDARHDLKQLGLNKPFEKEIEDNHEETEITNEPTTIEQQADSDNNSHQQTDDSFEYTIAEIATAQKSPVNNEDDPPKKNDQEEDMDDTKPEDIETTDKELLNNERYGLVESEENERYECVESDENEPNVSKEKTNEDIEIKHITKKIDCYWDPKHPLYEDIQSGFKSKSKIPVSRRVHLALQKLKTEKFRTGNIPMESEYVKEAKRIFPKGFFRENTVFEKSNTKQSPKSVKYAPSKPLIKQKGKFGQYTKVNTLYRSQSWRKVRQKEIPDSKKYKSVSDASDPNIDKHEVEQERSRTPEKKETVRKKNKHRTKYMELDDDKLNKDKERLQECQQYLEKNKVDLPQLDGCYNEDRNRKHSKAKPLNGYGNINNNSRMVKSVPDISFDSASSKHQSDLQSRRKSYQRSHLALHEFEKEHHASGNQTDRRAYSRDSVLMSGDGTPMASKGSGSADVSISAAVEIAQSRQRFYNGHCYDERSYIASSVIPEVKPRGDRVWQIFQELQTIRNGRKHSEGSRHGTNRATYMVDDTDDSSGFLLMNYASEKLKQRTNTELNKFLYESVDYELCSKGRPHYIAPSRKKKALGVLLQKVHEKRYTESTFSKKVT